MASPPRFSIAAISLVAALSGCVSPSPVSDGCGNVTQLFFGLAVPGGGEIGEAEWQAFLAETVTPRFPDGFTVFDGRGQYRQDGAVIREPSRMLAVAHRCDSAAESALREIVDDYKRRFRQESVLRIDLRGRVSF